MEGEENNRAGPKRIGGEPRFFTIDLQLFAEEKTEEPTPHRHEEVRKRGQVARSADLTAALGILAGVLFLYWRRQSLMDELCSLVEGGITLISRPGLTAGFLEALGRGAGVFLAHTVGPLLVVVSCVGLVVVMAQVGFVFSGHPVKPRAEQLNPARGLQRMFSRRSLLELGKALAKVVAVGVVAFYVVRSHLPELAVVGEMSLAGACDTIAQVLFRVGVLVSAVFLAVAVLDYFFQRREFHAQLKMTRHELKEEIRQTEGDPLIRTRLREKQRALARRRMIYEVPKATVVLTNPTRLAVALRYELDREKAPVVVAKGAGDIALRIIQVAKEHGVPVVENKALAQALYKGVDLGQEIPPELYQAVAEILAVIYRVRRPGDEAGRATV